MAESFRIGDHIQVMGSGEMYDGHTGNIVQESNEDHPDQYLVQFDEETVRAITSLAERGWIPSNYLYHDDAGG